MQNNQIQFSIYKINIEKTLEELNLDQELKIENICDKIIVYIKDYVRKCKDNVVVVEHDDLKLIYIRSTRTPIWKRIIEDIISEGNIIDKDGDIIKIENENTSYILFYIVENNIYAMTGGRGSNYINKFTEKNFGLYLIPKLVDKNKPIIKKIVENNLTGNNLSTQRIVKNITSVSVEENLGSIYRELSIQVSNEVGEIFGIKENDKQKVIGISSSDSVIIRKSINIEELKNILEKINELQKKEDKFVLNYFVPVRKKKIKESTLKELMVRKIQNEDYKEFENLSDSIEEYYNASCEYIVESNGMEIFRQTTPIKMSDLIQYVREKKKNISISAINNLLMKSEIRTIDSNGNIIIPNTKIYNLTRGCIEDENGCYYLMNGSWYVFENYYFSMLDKQYKRLFEENESVSKKLSFQYELLKKCENENDYNEKFKECPNIIKGHKKMIGYIELADLIFWDDDNVYLMCNKGKFNGEHVRDLVNQIYTSSKMLENIKLNDRSKLKEYYQKLDEVEKNKITQEKFMNLFEKNIYFIAGFLSEFNENTRSPYAKYLLVDLNKKFVSLNYKLVVMNYGA